MSIYFNWANFGPDDYPGIKGTSFNVGSTQAVGTTPSIAKNEFLIAMVTMDNTSVGTISVSGFTQLFQGVLTNTDTRTFWVGYKIAGSSETGSYTCTWNGTTVEAGWALASYFGVNTSLPIDANTFNIQDAYLSNYTSPTISPTNLNDMLLTIFMARGGSPITSYPTNINTRITPTANNNDTAYGTIVLADLPLTSNASVGGFGYSITYSDGALTASIALNSANVKTIAITSGSSWTVPQDWNSNNNIIEAIGGGGGGSSMFGYSGGGGQYAKITNFSATIGSSVPITIGQGGSGGSPGGLHYGADGTNTVFGATLVAVGGSGGNTTGTGGSGGSGSILNNGGNGWVSGVSSGGSGGGGAGGPGYTLLYGTPLYSGGNGGISNTGNRGSSYPAGGGGGGSQYLAGTGTSSSNSGGSGASSYDNAGQGGNGGSKSSGGTNGGAGIQWLLSNGASIGSGGGGGGGGSTGTNGQAGGNGGLYGGGGGSGGNGGGNGAGGAGANGIIVISYIPNPIPVANGITFQTLTVRGN